MLEYIMAVLVVVAIIRGLVGGSLLLYNTL